MRASYILGGIFMLILCFLGFLGVGNDMYAFKYGKKVDVIITYVPNCIFNNDVYYSFKFKYREKEYSKNVGTIICNKMHEGDKLTLIYCEEKNTFVDVDEKFTWAIITFPLLVGFGIFMIYYGYKK